MDEGWKCIALMEKLDRLFNSVKDEALVGDTSPRAQFALRQAMWLAMLSGANMLEKDESEVKLFNGN